MKFKDLLCEMPSSRMWYGPEKNDEEDEALEIRNGLLQKFIGKLKYYDGTTLKTYSKNDYNRDSEDEFPSITHIVNLDDFDKFTRASTFTMKYVGPAGINLRVTSNRDIGVHLGMHYKTERDGTNHF